MPRQDVDAASLAVVVERHFDLDQPPQLTQPAGPKARQPSVVRVEETRHVAARHAELKDDLSTASRDRLA